MYQNNKDIIKCVYDDRLYAMMIVNINGGSCFTKYETFSIGIIGINEFFIKDIIGGACIVKINDILDIDTFYFYGSYGPIVNYIKDDNGCGWYIGLINRVDLKNYIHTLYSYI